MANSMSLSELARQINNRNGVTLYFHKGIDKQGYITMQMSARINVSSLPYKYYITKKTGGGQDLVCECFNSLLSILNPAYFENLYQTYHVFDEGNIILLNGTLGIYYVPLKSKVILKNCGLQVSLEVARRMGYSTNVSFDEKSGDTMVFIQR